MKRMKKINTDFNLNSDSLGRKKKVSALVFCFFFSALVLMHSCFNGEIFCLGYSFLWGLAKV